MIRPRAALAGARAAIRALRSNRLSSAAPSWRCLRLSSGVVMSLIWRARARNARGKLCSSAKERKTYNTSMLTLRTFKQQIHTQFCQYTIKNHRTFYRLLAILSASSSTSIAKSSVNLTPRTSSTNGLTVNQTLRMVSSKSSYPSILQK